MKDSTVVLESTADSPVAINNSEFEQMKGLLGVEVFFTYTHNGGAYAVGGVPQEILSNGVVRFLGRGGKTYYFIGGDATTALEVPVLK